MIDIETPLCPMVALTLSDVLGLRWGVRQGSCLGPLLVSIYESKLFDVIHSHLPSVHAYAGYTQLYLSFCADGIDDQTAAFSAIERCIADKHHWMLHDKLKLKINDDKTECLLIGRRQQLAIVSFDTINVGSNAISSITIARDLGVWFDSNLTMSTHVKKHVPQPFSS